MKSWKIGAIAGLIAGIVAGIVHSIFLELSISLEFYPPSPAGRLIADGSTFFLGIIFGIIFALIYSKAYSVIPGKGVSKGIFYSLILFLLIWVQNSTFYLAYGLVSWATENIFAGFFSCITYGLVLGISYEYLRSRYYPIKKEPKIITYAVIGGVLPGAIAGIFDGIAAALVNAITSIIGIFGPEVVAGAPDIFTFDFWVYQSGAHIFWNMVWGIVIGMIFTQVYNLVPGKGIIKGLYYSLIIFVVYVLYLYTHVIGWGFIQLGLWALFVGIISTGTTLGLVLGYLYKPTK